MRETTRVGSVPPPRDEQLPTGFVVRLGEDTVVCGGTTLLGGSTGSVVRLRPRAAVIVEDGTVVVRDAVSAALARLLLDRGLAEPVWSTGEIADPAELAAQDVLAGEDVTVVVPVHDRPVQLARLLGALPEGIRVVVVDDGSRDPGAVATVAQRRGARLVVHEHNRGPAAARNTGLAAARTDLVAFVDSDVVPVAGWLAVLRRHFEDPATGAVAPRVRALHGEAGTGWVERYEAVRSSLDLGPRPASVRPHGRVSYVPSATLMVRAAAFADGFDDSMRVAEDVDAIWRTHRAGWRVRYEPAAVVRHDHRTETAAWLRRRMFYGTGAAPLAQRHGSAVAPMVLSPWTAVLTASLLAQRRWSLPVAAGSSVLATAVTAYRLRGAAAPLRTAATATTIGAIAALNQTASALTRHYWPVALPLAVVSTRARRAVLVAAVVDGVLDHRRARPDLDVARYVLARRLDDLAYGAGLWVGAVRARSPRALVPRWRSGRTAAAPPPDDPRTHQSTEVATPVAASATTSGKETDHGHERRARHC